jgi:hypothetical protein
MSASYPCTRLHVYTYITLHTCMTVDDMHVLERRQGKGSHLKGISRAIAVATLRPECLFRVTCERGAQISCSEIRGSLGGTAPLASPLAARS